MARVIVSIVMGVKKKDLTSHLSTTNNAIAHAINNAKFNGYLDYKNFPTKKGMEYAEEILGDGK